MLTAEEIYELLCITNEKNIEYRVHFVKRLETRARISDIIPNDIAEFKKILLNRCPVYVDYQENNELKDENEYRVFYNITEKYDLVVVLSLVSCSPIKIKFITLYQQNVNRRLSK